MAKISAGGATKVATWKKDETGEDGTRMITYVTLCSDGRLLRKFDFVYTYTHSGTYRNSGAYSIVAKNVTKEKAEAWATARGYTRA